MKLKNGLLFIVLFTLVLFSVSELTAFQGGIIPEFELTTTDGKVISTADLKDKKKLFLVFWATWCPGCKREIPELNKLYNKYKSQDIEFLGINVGKNDSEDRMKKFAKKYKIAYPVTFDKDSKVTGLFGIKGIPALIIADKSGTIIYNSFSLPENPEQLLINKDSE